jgi:hypothetical protein
MESRCSNCGGPLARGNALGACSRCGHALTGANWELMPPSRRVRRPPHAAWLIGGGALIGLGIAAVAFALFDEEEPPRRVRVPNVTVSVGSLAPARPAPGAPAPPQTPPPQTPPPSAPTSVAPPPKASSH